MKSILTISVASAALLCGCMHKTTMINTYNDQAGAVAGFDYRDITNCLDIAVSDLLLSARLDRADGGRYLVNVMEIKNDTASLGRDADALSNVLGQGLKERLTNQQKILVYNPSVAQYATVRVDPQLALYGTVAERNIRMDNGVIQKEDYLTLTLVEISTGVEFWQKTVFIGKRVDARNALW